MMTTTSLNPKYLRALLSLAAKDDIRYFLNVVCVELTATETRYVACNGHLLGVIRDDRFKKPPQEPATILIPREAIEALPKMKAHNGLSVSVELRYDPAAPFAEARLGNIFFKPIEGKYPNYRKVIPEKANGEKAHYKPEYLLAFQTVARSAFGPSAEPDLWENGDAGALVLLGNEPNFVGVVMPMRAASSGVAPAWAREPVAEPAPTPVAANAAGEVAFAA